MKKKILAHCLNIHYLFFKFKTLQSWKKNVAAFLGMMWWYFFFYSPCRVFCEIFREKVINPSWIIQEILVFQCYLYTNNFYHIDHHFYVGKSIVAINYTVTNFFGIFVVNCNLILFSLSSIEIEFFFIVLKNIWTRICVNLIEPLIKYIYSVLGFFKNRLLSPSWYHWCLYWQGVLF